MKKILPLLLFLSSCVNKQNDCNLVGIQIQDRNGILETVNQKEKLLAYDKQDFTKSQPYRKVMRFYKDEGQNTSVITTYHPTGALWQYLEASNLRASGKYEEFYPSGRLKIEAVVIAGPADLNQLEDLIFDGKNYVYFEDGTPLAIIEYKKGKLDGKSSYFYPNGSLEKELNFSENTLDEEAKSYFFDGKLASVETYKRGSLVSGKYFDKSENLIATIVDGFGQKAEVTQDGFAFFEYRKGVVEGDVIFKNLDGRLVKKYQLKAGKKQGIEEHYFDYLVENKPQQKMRISWKDDMIHGEVTTYYPNGNVESVRQFCQNKKSGPSIAYYPDGSFMLVEEYEEDRLLEGKYFRKGQKEIVSNVRNGYGTSTIFDDAGVMIRKVVYQKGKPEIQE